MSFNRCLTCVSAITIKIQNIYPLHFQISLQSVPSPCPQTAGSLLYLVDQFCLPRISYKWNNRMCVTVVQFLSHHMFLRFTYVSVFIPFLLLSDILIYEFTTFSLLIHLLMDFWVFPRFRLLGIERDVELFRRPKLCPKMLWCYFKFLLAVQEGSSCPTSSTKFNSLSILTV